MEARPMSVCNPCTSSSSHGYGEEKSLVRDENERSSCVEKEVPAQKSGRCERRWADLDGNE
eukprot:11296477-Karenia_brevis.AAC.1